jgi:hypothetical protein
MKLDEAPRLSNLPFIIGDVTLVVLAGLIAILHSNPFSPLPLIAITGCVVLGVGVFMIPYIANYARDQEIAAAAMRQELAEQFKRLITASEHLQHATVQLKSIEEASAKAVTTAEGLPYRLQEKIADFNQQLVETGAKEKAMIDQELTRLRSSESERLSKLAAQIAQSLADGAKLAIDTRQQFVEAMAREQGLFEQQLVKMRAAENDRLAAGADGVTKSLADWVRVELDARQQFSETMNREKELFEQQLAQVRSAENARLATATDGVTKVVAECAKIGIDLRQQFADAVAREKSLFEQQLAQLRSAEDARLANAAVGVTTALAGWERIEQDARKQLSATTELQEKLAGLLATVDAKVASLEAAIEAAAKAAEKIQTAPPAPAIVLPVSPEPATTEPVVASVEPPPAVIAETPASEPPPPVITEETLVSELPPPVVLDQPPIAEAAAALASEPAPEPVPAPIIEPAIELTPAPEPPPAVAAEPAPEPVPEPVPEPPPTAIAPEPAPVAEAAPAFALEPASEPALALAPEPAIAPTAAPSPEPEAPPAAVTPEPTPAVELAPAVAPEVAPAPTPEPVPETPPAVIAPEPATKIAPAPETPPAATITEPAPALTPAPAGAPEPTPETATKPEVVLAPAPEIAAEPAPAVPASTPIEESTAVSTATPEPDEPEELEPLIATSDTAAPAVPPKPRKPRAPRKPRSEGSAPAEPPPPVELISEPVMDEPPAPEDFSQLPPEENKPAANRSADGRTRLTVTSYIGIGNKLHLRGEGPGLSQTKGVPLQFVSIGRWRWETDKATEPVICRIYKNDRLEAPIGVLTLLPGTENEVSAQF